MHNNNLITYLTRKGYIKDYSAVLDWLLDDERLKTINKNQKTKMIKKIKSFPNVKKDNYFYCAKKELRIPTKKNQGITIAFSKRDSELSDLLRHLRNSISHKRVYVVTQKGIDFIECHDVGKYRKNEEISAYFYMPLSFLMDLFKCFKMIKKEFGNQ